jgi:hypothetical protein
MIRTFLVGLGLCFFFHAGKGQNAKFVQPEIRGVIRAGTEIRLVKDGFHGLEGPVPAPDGGLYFSAINENRIYRMGSGCPRSPGTLLSADRIGTLFT